MASLFAAPISALTAGNKVAESLSNTIAASGAVAGPSFQTYLVSSASGGVSSTSIRQLNGVGSPTAGAATNFAIAGSGFAIVRNLPGNTADGKGTIGYTRIGTFEPDSAGNFRNSSGQYLQALPIDQTTGLPASLNIDNLVTLSTGGLTQAAAATTKAAFTTQLSSNAEAGTIFSQTIQVFDSLGIAHNVTFVWEKQTTAQTWNVTACVDGAVMSSGTYAGSLLPSSPKQAPPTAGGVAVTFNDEGALDTPSTFSTLDITWPGGAAPSSIDLDFSKITSRGSQSQIIASPVVDGSSFGTFKSLNITADGTVSVTFNNDKTIKYARIPLAIFQNPNGLVDSGTGDGVFAASGDTGESQMVFPGVDGSGSLSTGKYEASPNDSTKAYINLIEVSRYFANNVKVIQTAQKMYDKLDQL